VTDIFAPASGQVVETNKTVIDEPGLVNRDPYGAGWLVKMELRKPSELDALMDSGKYDEFVSELTENESDPAGD
jgi:glycine cleavage system H protein